MQTSNELGGQTFSGFQEHSFEAATVQETPLYSVVNLRIKLAVTFPSPNQAILRLVFFFLLKKKQVSRLGTFRFFLCRTAQHNLKSRQTLLMLHKVSTCSK